MNERIKKALTAFLQFRAVRGLAPRTLRDYEYFIGQYAALVPNDSEDYRSAALEYLSQSLLSNNTLRIRHAYLKCFFTWSIEEGFFTCAHPMRGLKKRPATSRIVNVERETIFSLLAQPDKTSFSGLRDYALLFFSLDTGARPTEALSLRAEHFNFRDNTVTIAAEFAKTRRTRIIPISKSTADIIKQLIAAHRSEWNNSTVFCGQDGTPFLGTSWTHQMKKYSKKIGVSVTPYYLRHAAALALLRGGASAFHVQKILGHTDISMTQRYISLQLDDLREAHAKASLINTIIEPTQPIHRQRKIS